MKKIVLGLAFALFASLCLGQELLMAANKGSNGANSNNTEPWDGNTSTFTYSNGVFNMTEVGKITLKLYQPATKNGQNVVDFGYYFVKDGEVEKISLVKDHTGSGKAIIHGNEEFETAELDKDAKIGFYIQDDTQTVFSEASRNSGKVTDLFFPLTDTKKDFNYFTFGLDGTSWTQGGVLAFGASGSGSHGPNGQPLPGILTTLVLGGAALVGGKKLKNRRNNK